MDLLNDQLKRISDKLQLLLKQKHALQKENEQLHKLISDLKKKEEAQRINIEEMEQKLAVLKTAAGKLSEADKKDFEKKLNFYIREIDRCIAMLSE
jgi:chromosome segregation ATPase